MKGIAAIISGLLPLMLIVAAFTPAESTYTWTFEDDLSTWEYRNGHTNPDSPNGTLTQSTTHKYGSYSMKLTTADPEEEGIWYYGNAINPLTYQNVTDYSLTGYFMIENTSKVGALNLVGCQLINDTDRICDSGFEWINNGVDPPTWFIWQSGDYGNDTIGAWIELEDGYQNLQSGVWYSFEVSGTVYGYHTEFRVGSKTFAVQDYPVNVSPQLYIYPETLTLELSVVSRPYETAVVYFDNVAWSG